LVENLITRYPEDINAIGGDYGTPLHAAAAEGHAEVVLLLLKHLPADIRNPRTPLFSATQRGQTEIGQHLLNHGADVNARMVDDSTPLHLAGLFSHLKFVRLLLDHGADPYARNDVNQLPLRKSLKNRRLEILQLFSEYNFTSDEI